MEERFVLGGCHIFGDPIVFPGEQDVKALGVVQGPLREAPVVGDLGNHCTPKHSRQGRRRATGTTYLPDNGVQLLSDDSKLGAVRRLSGVIPDPQAFEAVFMLEGNPGWAPGGAIDPETARGAIVRIGVLFPTDMIRAKFVFCYSHAGDRCESGDKYRYSLKLGKGGRK